MTTEEKEYLKQYNIANYERPSLTVDICTFSLLRDKADADIRSVDVYGLQVLLIRRASYPFKGKWALPGGFCVPDEDVRETAVRELYEETGIRTDNMKLMNVYGEKGRDPRGWIISNTYRCLVNQRDCRLRADTDAWEAEWFTVKSLQTDRLEHKKIHTLILEHNEQELVCSVVETKQGFADYNQTLAFDHARIIIEALLDVRKQIRENICPVFSLLPECFTLGELQAAYELLLGKSVDNFRRKVSGSVEETGAMREGKGFRPAKLYRKRMGI